MLQELHTYRRPWKYHSFRYNQTWPQNKCSENVKQLRHYIIPTLINDKRNAIAIDVGTNDTLNQVNHEDIAHSIMNIGLDCKNNGLNEVFISYRLYW